MSGSGSEASRMSKAGGNVLDSVAFVNPEATQARMRRRAKLAASRIRLLAQAAQGGGGGAGATGDDKEVRKQQRILRNRESAALSRKRKSDRIGELEIQVGNLEEENRRLRQRINDLESQAIDLGLTPPGSPESPALSSTPGPVWENISAARTMASTTASLVNVATQGTCSLQDQSTISAFTAISGPAIAASFNFSQPAVFA